MNENTHYAKYLSWIDIPLYKKINKPMAIIGIVCNVLVNFSSKQIKSFKFKLNHFIF